MPAGRPRSVSLPYYYADPRIESSDRFDAFVAATAPRTKLPPTLLGVIPRRLYEWAAMCRLDGDVTVSARMLWRAIAYDTDLTPDALLDVLTQPGGYIEVADDGRLTVADWDKAAGAIHGNRERWRRARQRKTPKNSQTERPKLPNTRFDENPIHEQNQPSGIIRADIREISPNERERERKREHVEIREVREIGGQAPPPPLPSAPPPSPNALTPEQVIKSIAASAKALGWPDHHRKPGVRMLRVLYALGWVEPQELAEAFRAAQDYDQQQPGASLVVSILERKRGDRAAETAHKGKPRPRLAPVEDDGPVTPPDEFQRRMAELVARIG